MITMAEINYCPRCKTAVRMHISKRVFCKRCLEEYKKINVTRSRYFIIQLPLLMLGIAFLIYTIMIIPDERGRLAETMGYMILTIAIFLFTLGFQVMDSKAMEEDAIEIGRHKYPTDDDEMGDTIIYKPRRSMLTGLPVKSKSLKSRALLLNEPLKYDDTSSKKLGALDDEDLKFGGTRESKKQVQKSMTSFDDSKLERSLTKKSHPRKIRKAL